MTNLEFQTLLIKGLGAAPLFLKENPGLAENYYNDIFWACTNELRFDRQSEEPRAAYLYDLVRYCGNEQLMQRDLLEYFMSCKDYDALWQLFDLIERFYLDGNLQAREYLYKRFDNHIDAMTYDAVAGEFIYALPGYETLINIDGLAGLEHIAEVAGNMINRYGSEYIADLEAIPFYAAEKLDMSTAIEFLELKSRFSANIKRFYGFVLSRLDSMMTQLSISEPPVDFDAIISEVERCISGQTLQKEACMKLAHLGAKAGRQALKQTAIFIENTLDKRKRELLMYTFGIARYPLDRRKFIDMLDTDDLDEIHALINIVKDLKSPKLRKLGLKFLENSDTLLCGLELLVLNFKNDYEAIGKALLSAASDIELFHNAIEIAISVIFNNLDERFIHILSFLYRESPCSLCREQIVKCMASIDMLEGDVVKECLFDCSTNIRNLAKRINTDRNFGFIAAD